MLKDSDFDYAFYIEARDIFGKLNVPEAELFLRPSSTEKAFDVYDMLRRKWVALTPEEWVRQHFVRYMIEHLGYSAFRLANEVPLRFNNTSRRADTVVYDDVLKPLAVVEYKAPEITLGKETLEQALRYNLVFNAPGVMITNGLQIISVLNGKFIPTPLSLAMLSEQ